MSKVEGQMQYRNAENVFQRSVIVFSFFCTCTVVLTVAVQDNKLVLQNGAKLGQKFHVGIFGTQIVLYV